jgi:hypothetical protein
MGPTCRVDAVSTAVQYDPSINLTEKNSPVPVLV